MSNLPPIQYVRQWRVRQGNLRWKPRGLMKATRLAQRLLWGSDMFVTIEVVNVPKKRRKTKPDGEKL